MPEEQHRVAESPGLVSETSAAVSEVEIPEPVSRRLAAWAADSLGSLPADRTPAALRRVARFSPAKRARAGQAALLAAVRSDQLFRAHVAEYARARTVPAIESEPAAAAPTAAASAVTQPGAAASALTQPGVAASEVAEQAALAYLLHLPSAPELLAKAALADRSDLQASRIAELERQLTSADAARRAAESARDEARENAQRAPAAPGVGSDVEKLRGRLREQGTQLRELRDRLDAESARSAGEVEGLTQELARARAEIKALQERLIAARARADRATQQLEAVSTDAAAHQQSVDRKVELLLDALEQAASGLRRQLQLNQGGRNPADVVADQLPMTVRATGRAADAVLLTEWLGLPQAHLIVDGYNISKTGYPALTLADQRERLVRELAAVTARTGCETTVVFDGAAVIAPQSRLRGVRVIFSPPGVIADEVIRRLVTAEPVGRVLVVATADREILQSVISNGARTVTPQVLLALMSPHSASVTPMN